MARSCYFRLLFDALLVLASGLSPVYCVLPRLTVLLLHTLRCACLSHTLARIFFAAYVSGLRSHPCIW